MTDAEKMGQALSRLRAVISRIHDEAEIANDLYEELTKEQLAARLGLIYEYMRIVLEGVKRDRKKEKV